jgi:hypothetical protein
MVSTAEDILKLALQLPESDRARVAAEILSSLGPALERRDDDAWITEVERRAQAAIAGEPGLSWPQVLDHVEGRLARDRK